MNKIRIQNGTFQENKEITKWVQDNQDKYLCACGCGNYIQMKRVYFRTGITKYIHGHNSIAHRKEISEQVKNFFQTEKGKKQALEHGKFMEEYYKTHDAYWKNHKIPKEVSQKQGETLRRKYASGEIIQHQKGKTWKEMYGEEKAEELRKINAKICKGKTGKLAPHWGRKHTEESKKKMSKKICEKYINGYTNWNTGKKDVYSEETKRKMSLSHGGTGIPYENTEYGAEFDDDLKEGIWFRDKYKCQLCGCSQLENKRQLDIHHIDYNKQNHDRNNLISLCVSCHVKTRYNRKRWTEYFKKEVLICPVMPNSRIPI